MFDQLPPVVTAAMLGRADEVDRLLKLNRLEPAELKGLAFIASKNKSLSTLQVLLDNGWDINLPESYAEPPFLGCAIKAGGTKDVVRWFLDHGADPNAYAKQHKLTPLSRAVEYASLEVVGLLLECGGDASRGELVNFACKRHAKDPETLAVLELIVEKGAPIDDRLYEKFPELSDVTMFESTPLFNSCVTGNLPVARFLVEKGATLRPPALLRSPIDEANSRGHFEIVRLLQSVVR